MISRLIFSTTLPKVATRHAQADFYNILGGRKRHETVRDDTCTTPSCIYQQAQVAY